MYPCAATAAFLPPAGHHRHRMPWDPSETRRLGDLCAQGVRWSEIARLLGRTEAAVKAQAKKLVAATAEIRPAVAIVVQADMLPARMRRDELLKQRERTGLTFEQLAARAGILSGPGILYVVAAGKNQLASRYTNAIRDLPDAQRPARVPAPVPAEPEPAPGFVTMTITVPKNLAASFQAIAATMGTQQ
ncbi:hypothetical protein GCM10009639_47950 [Kitasatospora putterlickiae]|uniref:Uncharacterized protein n=1 Tax=Kitasatospora putterlickiae TaxID=221725 RepID=A0ABP4IZP1_9ACTN